jgi:hypothetical protein
MSAEGDAVWLVSALALLGMIYCLAIYTWCLSNMNRIYKGNVTSYTKRKSPNSFFTFSLQFLLFLVALERMTKA